MCFRVAVRIPQGAATVKRLMPDATTLHSPRRHRAHFHLPLTLHRRTHPPGRRHREAADARLYLHLRDCGQRGRAGAEAGGAQDGAAGGLLVVCVRGGKAA